VGEAESRDAQMALLDELIADDREKLSDLTKDPQGLENQLERVQLSLFQQQEQLSTTETSFRQLADRRRALRKRLEEVEDREAEVRSLIERFELLDKHYASDIARLRGIEEGGSLFEVLARGPCPLCGSAPEHHSDREQCDANVAPVVDAARSEIAKIELLKKELAATRAALARERQSFDRTMPRLQDELRAIAQSVEGLSAPLARMRSGYAELSDKRSEVRQAVTVRERIRDLERRRQELEGTPQSGQDSAVAEGDLPAAVADEFAQAVEAILRAWHFPGAERVHFDSKSRDLVISGKHRSAYGKGLRAITHAAFTVGLLIYCREHDTPHPGFVVLDSPLLAYRAPEGAEDDLTGKDLKEQFYRYLAELPDDRQVIVIENVDPPSAVMGRPQSQFFSANPRQGRYGFFPVEGTDKREPA
jgi:predicted nuclease with TOPRIM domain